MRQECGSVHGSRRRVCLISVLLMVLWPEVLVTYVSVRWSRGLARNILLCVVDSMHVLTLVSSFGCSICRDDRDNEVYLGLSVSIVRVEGEECVVLVFCVYEVVTSALLDAFCVST